MTSIASLRVKFAEACLSFTESRVAEMLVAFGFPLMVIVGAGASFSQL